MRYTSSRYGAIPHKDWGGALTGASTGFKMGSSVGMMFGPVGGAIAGGIGALTGAIFGNRGENKRMREQKKQDDIIAKLKLDEKNKAIALNKKQTFANDKNYLDNLDLNNQASLFMKKGGWIQKANASIKRRGTKGVCTGSNFGGSSCRPGTRRYALAKTFKKMAKNRQDGGPVDENTVSIRDNRVIDTLTGKPLSNKNRFHATVDKEYIKKVVSIAKKHNVDPSTALAINMAETGFDDNRKHNPMMLHFSNVIGKKQVNLDSSKRDLINYYKGYTGEDVVNVNDRGDITVRNKSGYSAEAYPELKDNKYLKKVREQTNEIDSIIDNPIDTSIKFMKDKFDHAKRSLGKTTDENIIQSYNGYGTIKNKGKMYGINTDSTAINMNKNPIYGKRIVNLRDSVLRTNPDIINIIKNTKANGGKIATTGINLKDGNKLLTKNGSTSGTHESGANIPIKKNGKTVAIAEPGEVLVTDKDITSTPFVLSKRLGFAQKFMELEGIKNIHNKDIIEDRQSKLVTMNNKMVRRGKYASSGTPIKSITAPKFNNAAFNLPKGTLQSYKGTKGNSSRAGNIFGDIINGSKNLDMNTIAGAVGTVGNLLMTNKTLKRQKGLINNSLNEALAYTPNLNKNYLLNDNINVNDQVSSINQGYSSSISGLNGIDPAIASALKTSANVSRTNSLNSVFANRNNIQTGIRNQNTMNIMNNNSSNNSLLNDTALMKLNAKIAANEQLGDAESARLGNVQGAIGEFNTILRDKDIMKSLDARWKDSIGKDYTGKIYGCGGRIGKKRKHAMAR